MQQALKQKEVQVQYEIIEPAFRPLKPVKPNRIRFILVGAFVGLAVGMMIIFVQEYIDDSFKEITDVESYLGIVVLGTIPNIEMGPQKRVWKNKLKLKSLVTTVLSLIGSLIYF
jgi:capsular polysaccharide biosynthesis protein